MIKGDYIEYEFDLFSIEKENVVENFKKIFGEIITKKGLNYEIYELNDSKMMGGSSSTFPYNKFEDTIDILVGKKKELSVNSKGIYELLFSDFKGTLENQYAKTLLKQAETTDGYYEDVINAAKKRIEDKDLDAEKASTPAVEQEITPAPAVEQQIVPTLEPAVAVEQEITPTPALEPQITPTPAVEEEITPAPAVEQEITPTPEPTLVVEKEITPTPEPAVAVEQQLTPDNETARASTIELGTPVEINDDEIVKSSIIRIKLIVQHKKNLLQLEDIKKG